MQKLNVAVLFGGCSPEYGVSLESAHAVLTHMDRARFNPIPVGISRGGEWFYFHGGIERIARDTWCNPSDCTPAAISPNRGSGRLMLFRPEGVETLHVDAAFPVLHGKNGEDGTVQGLLALAGIPVAGCGVLSSALCMDKDRAHRLVAAAGISVPKSVLLDRPQSLEARLPQIEALALPIFVKPVRAGSSYGIARLENLRGLRAAVGQAFRYDDQVIIEEGVPGFEVGCAVMGNDRLITGEVDEIELAGGFFDFDEKYTLKTSAIHVPARTSPEKAEEIKSAARRIYRILNCRCFARVDMFLTPEGEIVFNEVNTIPGFTAHSRFPSMMRAVGIGLQSVITRAIEWAVIS